MSFTNDEIEAAVAKLLRTSVRREYGALGNRRIDLTFNDVKNAAAGVFILDKSAPFYVVKLAADRVAQLIASEQEHIGNFIETIRLLGRRVKPVSKVSSLANAKTALDALASSADDRTSAHEDIEEVPAYKRFNSNVERFFRDTRDAITKDGEVVQTPNEARGNLSSLRSELEEQHEEILRRVALLERAVDDFSSLELSSLLSQDILANARSLLSQDIDELEGLTAEERLTILRKVTLNLLAIRSTVKGFGSLQPPTQFLLLEGTGGLFADSDHPATPATLSSDLYGPYTLVDGAGSGIDLDFALDGDVGTANTTRIQLLGSYDARLEGTVKGPYDLQDPNGDGYNANEFVLGLRNWPTKGAETLITVTFPASGPLVPVMGVAENINTAITGLYPTMPLFAEPYANPLKFTGPVDINATPIWGSDADIIALGGTADFGALGVEVGDWVRVTDDSSSNYGSGATAFGFIFQVESLQSTTTTNDTLAVQLQGLGPVTDEQGASGGKVIEVGGGTMPLRLRIHNKASEPAGDYRAQAIDDRVSVILPESTGGTTKDEQYDALIQLGFYPLMEALSRATDARDLAEYITQSSSAALAGSVRMEAEAVFSPTLFSGSGRSDPNDFFKVALYGYRGDATVSYASPNNTFVVAGDLTSTLSPGDVVVVRDGVSDSAEVDSWGLLSSVTLVGGSTELVAIMSVPVVSTTGTVTVEVGPYLTLAPYNPTLRILDTANANDYEVVSIGTVPLEVFLDGPLPNSVGAGNLPVPFEAELGQWRLDFSSADTSLTTAIAVDGSLAGESSSTARSRFFNSLTNEAVGSSVYFQLPEWSKALEEGDILELYSTQYNSPDYSRTIQGLEESNELVEVAQGLPTSLSSFEFSTKKELPFARIRKLQLNTYEALKDNLSSYLELESGDSSYFVELNRRLNPLAVNTNPTIFQVNDPVLYLQQLSLDLDTLSGYLTGYQAKVVDEVENLIGSFQQKGADRAVDLLFEANFSGFFGADVDELSYSGALQKKIRDTQREDLPVRKTERVNENIAEDTLIASYEEPDFEFNRSDIDNVEDVAIPVGSPPGVPYPGSSF